MTTQDIYTLMQTQGLSLSTDTRTLSASSIYIGIKGDIFDGNTFVADAFARGAQYAIIDNPAYKLNDACILVSDTKKFLADIAHIHRKTFSIPILAIGGSNGKTTTKELVAAVLQTRYRVHVTAGNFNNDIGVPLTLLAMPKDTEIAVIEIGANHPLEHTTLLAIVAPTHILVTNNGADHLEGFGSLAGARMANKELYDWAQQHNATAFVNKNIPDLLEDSSATQQILYPAKETRSMSSLYAGIQYGDVSVISSLFGAFNEPNMLAAIAVGEFFNIPINMIQEAVAGYIPTLKRSQVIQKEEYMIILDCYNANPTSMELSLRDFITSTPETKRIFVLGDMLELGTEEQELHKGIMSFVAQQIKRDDIVLYVGPRFYHYKDAFPGHFFADTASARAYFNTLDLYHTAIFLKASRGIKIETVITEKVPQ